MSDERQCAGCGSTQLQPGTIQSTGRIYFRPEGTKFMQLKSADVEIHANVCMQCGQIMLIADAQRVSSLLRIARPH